MLNWIVIIIIVFNWFIIIVIFDWIIFIVFIAVFIVNRIFRIFDADVFFFIAEKTFVAGSVRVTFLTELSEIRYRFAAGF